MTDQELQNVLVGILEVLKQQAIFLDRQFAWIIALAETIGTDAALESKLTQHPLYDLGREPRIAYMRQNLENIEALIQRLKVQP